MLKDKAVSYTVSGSAVLSYANPAEKEILHIADMMRGAVSVCALIHTGMSHL